MKKQYLLLILFLLSLCSTNLEAQRKKVAFALSGGGAKGLAHIGVLKVFEEAGIYPDMITGTSMGSVVGGLYAIGYNAGELDSLANALDWPSYFSDSYNRSYRTIEEKENEERYIFSFPVKDGKVKLPKGFVDGQKLTILLSNLTQKVHSIKNFDDFNIPFRCVGGDLETGEAVVFDSGFLPDAIRASIGIPSVFEPIEINGRFVVDGMIVRNLPVQDAFDMGADIVIAVDVGSGLYKRDELSSIFSVLEQTSSYSIVESNKQQLNLADVIVRPDMSDYSALDFGKADSLIAEGEAAARAMLPDIQKLLEGIPTNQVYKKGIVRELPEEVTISDIEVIGLVGQDEKTFLKILQLQVGKEYEIEKIADQINRAVATGFYEDMSYRLVQYNKGYRLRIRANKTDNISIRMGANYHSTFNAGLLLNGTVRNALLPGSKFSLDIRASENPAMLMDYLYYTKTRPNIGLKLSGLINLFPGFLYLDKVLNDEYNFLEARTRLDIFSGLGINTSIGIGISLNYQRLDQRFLELEVANPNLDQLRVHFNFDFDNLNRKYFPTKGTKLRLSGNLTLEGSLENSTEDGSRSGTFGNMYHLFEFQQIFKIDNRFVVQWYNHAGFGKYNNPDLLQLFFLGRALPYGEKFIPFTGFNYMQLAVDRFAFTGLRFQIEPKDGFFIAMNSNYGYNRIPAYAYVSSDGFQQTVNDQGPMSGIGLELGALSNFGPISLTGEYNFEGEVFNFLFQMGFLF